MSRHSAQYPVATLASVLLAVWLWPAPISAYPLDGYDYTGIRRLDFYQRAQTGEVRGRQLPAGALLPLSQVTPRLALAPSELALVADPEKSAQLTALLKHEADHYGVALIDLSDPQQPAYAAHQEHWQANVGSVGKMLVAVALFQKLAEIYPGDLAARERVLRDTLVVADRFIIHDHHKVPLWNPQSRRFRHRALQIGDRGSLWEFLDWMLSASSNAAGSVVMKELLLLDHFGRDYPAPPEASADFLSSYSRRQLGERLQAAMLAGVQNSRLDPQSLFQGSFFTREGKRRVSGTRSFATPKQLVTLLYRLETGQLVDAFSSRELKRLLYMTQRRIRYASHPGMHADAIFFKSGSLYRCRPEPDFVCRKYHGNVENRLASVAIIESPAGQPRYHYLVAVMSNVLRKNSAVAHQTLAIHIQRLIESWHSSSANQPQAGR